MPVAHTTTICSFSRFSSLSPAATLLVMLKTSCWFVRVGTAPFTYMMKLFIVDIILQPPLQPLALLPSSPSHCHVDLFTFSRVFWSLGMWWRLLFLIVVRFACRLLTVGPLTCTEAFMFLSVAECTFPMVCEVVLSLSFSSSEPLQLAMQQVRRSVVLTEGSFIGHLLC